MLRKFALYGRDDEEGVEGVLPALASFCLKKEEVSAQEYCAASNMTGNKKGVVMNHLYRLLHGLMVKDKMGTSKFTFIRTVIHNNLIGGNSTKEMGKPNHYSRNQTQSTCSLRVQRKGQLGGAKKD
eukprot:5689849-Ditylum_brightwellii.AAC.1